ncbi:MAG: PIN domain-containing protein [Gemmatimonadota bacterium]|nr:PIN domain-containing protein [Gemmatimonadota bacterium]
MRQAIDAGILAQAHIPSTPEDHKVRRFLLNGLNTPGRKFALTPGTLHEFVHLVTDPRRFKPPLSMAEALSVTRLYLGKSNVEVLATDEECVADAVLHSERLGLQGDRFADALLAATLLKNDIREIVTTNPEDYETFEELRVIDPLET